MLFALKKIISGLLYPSALIFMSLCAGLIFLAAGRRLRPAVFFFLSGLVLISLSFFPWVPDALLRRLETQYEPYSAAAGFEPEWILVLGQGIKCGDIPESSRINGVMYARLMEAVRISREHAEAGIVVSFCGDVPPHDKRKCWDFFCGNTLFPVRKSVVLTSPRDTEEELRLALQYIGSSPFVLVTSASHMPRAMRVAGVLGGKAIPAPCDFEGRFDRPACKYLLPSSRNLYRTEVAVHEYLGLLWLRVTSILQHGLN